jgi:hypothetical protein
MSCVRTVVVLVELLIRRYNGSSKLEQRVVYSASAMNWVRVIERL